MCKENYDNGNDYIGKYVRCSADMWQNRLIELCGDSVEFKLDPYGYTAWLNNKQVGSWHKSGYGQVM